MIHHWRRRFQESFQKIVHLKGLAKLVFTSRFGQVERVDQERPFDFLIQGKRGDAFMDEVRDRVEIPFDHERLVDGDFQQRQNRKRLVAMRVSAPAAVIRLI